MSMIIDGSLGATFNDGSLQTAAASPFGLKNRIINGDMRIDQRNAGASVTGNNSTYSVDRWFADTSASSKFTMQQNAGSITPPVGFTNYLGITSSSAYSVTSSDYFLLEQRIEGFNIADLAWGTASAKPVTLSFQVYSSLTGTFGGALGNSGNNQSYPFSYTISSANTWTTVSVNISGATSGTWLTTNGIGIKVFFGLGVGSTYSGTAGSWSNSLYLSATGATSVVGTNGATFYITGVQLEIGTSATPFERRLYNQELANCQRYFISYGGDSVYNKAAYGGAANSSTIAVSFVSFPVQMRSAPSFGSTGSWTVSDGVTGTTVTALAVVANQTSSLIGMIQATVASGLTTYRAYWLESTNTTAAKISWSAEL